MRKIWALALVAAVATACSDSTAPVEMLTPDGLNPANVTLYGGTSTDIQNAVNTVSNSGGGTVTLNGDYHMTGPVRFGPTPLWDT